MIVKAAREDNILNGPKGGGGARRPPLASAGTVGSCDTAFDDAGQDECGADGAGIEGGVGYLWECPGVYGREHFPSSFEVGGRESVTQYYLPDCPRYVDCSPSTLVTVSVGRYGRFGPCQFTVRVRLP